MGWLHIEEGIEDGTGKRIPKIDLTTVACAHCQAVVAVVVRGSPAAHVKETKYRCTRCRAPICKFCATTLKGECSPIHYKIELALKHGRWPRHVPWIPVSSPAS